MIRLVAAVILVSFIGIAQAETIRDATRPMIIELAIVPAADIAAIDPNAAALAYADEGGCRILLPSGRMVRMNTTTRRAAWEDRTYGDLFAHEIMHCLNGKWHRE